MKNLILIVILIVLACSCTTMDRCNRKYPPVESFEISDSVVTKTITVYKDSLIPYKVDPDTVTLFKYIYTVKDPEHPSLIDIDSISLENDFSLAWAWVDQSTLGLSLVQKDTTLEFLLDDAVRETKHWMKLYHSELRKEVKVVRYIPKFYRFCSYYFYITATALIMLLIFKLKKFLPF